MKKLKVPLGFLTAGQLASDCRSHGLPVSAEHTIWILKKKLVPPIATLSEVDYYSEYQIYLLDLIQDRRLQTLDYPKAAGITRAGKKLKSYFPEVTWQEYVLLNKRPIVEAAKQWNPIAKLLLEIQPLYNEFLHNAMAAKERLKARGDGWDEKIDMTMQFLMENDGPTRGKAILKNYPTLSEDILRYWKNHVLPVCAIKHNPAILLSSQRPDLLEIFSREEGRLSTIFTMGNPIRLANFYMQMISYLQFFISCLNEGREPRAQEIFISHKSPKICLICGASFIPNPKRKGGKLQTLCGKPQCNREQRRRRAIQYRKRKA